MRLILLDCHDVIKKSCFKDKGKDKKNILMLSRISSMQNAKKSITKFQTLSMLVAVYMDIYRKKSSIAFIVSLRSYPGLLFCIKAVACALRLLVTEEMNKSGGKVILQCRY